ncbi:MAG: acetyl-CoA carboxylase biotin carboxylase subunit family protein [Anaerofustis sp.]
MNKLAIIGAGEFQLPLIQKASELGYETHVFAWEDGAVGKKEADFFYPISVLDECKILSICEQIKPDGVVSIASEVCYVTATRVAFHLGLPCNDPSYLKSQTNKYHMRKAFASAGLAVPKFFMTKERDFNPVGMEFPLIVKPTDRSGSRAIYKIVQLSDLQGALERALKESFEHEAIIEEFFDGDEFSCECISSNGKHTALAFTKKYTTNAPHFIETGHIQPAELNCDINESIQEEVFRALDALNVKNGASHTEFRMNRNGKMCIMEIGARMGGDCIGSHLVPLSTGYDYMKMVIDIATGKSPSMLVVSTKNQAAVKFIFNENDRKKVDNLEQMYPEAVIFRSRRSCGDFQDIADSSMRWGYTIFSTNDDCVMNEVKNIVCGS